MYREQCSNRKFRAHSNRTSGMRMKKRKLEYGNFRVTSSVGSWLASTALCDRYWTEYMCVASYGLVFAHNPNSHSRVPHTHIWFVSFKTPTLHPRPHPPSCIVISDDEQNFIITLYIWISSLFGYAYQNNEKDTVCTAKCVVPFFSRCFVGPRKKRTNWNKNNPGLRRLFSVCWVARSTNGKRWEVGKIC